MLAISGRLEAEQWNSSKNSASFYSIKGIVKSVLQRLGLYSLLRESSLTSSLLEDGVELHILKKSIGQMGWASSSQKKHFGIKQDVFIAELDFDAIIESLSFSKTKYSELPKTFSVRRDYSLLLDKTTRFSEIEAIARKANKKLLKEVNLFDVYEGDKLPEGKKSYAISFSFQDEQETLKDEQVDNIMKEIRIGLEGKLNAELR